MLCRKNSWLAGILFTFCLSFFGSARQETVPARAAPPPVDNEAALRALVKEFFTTYAKKDLEGWKGL